MGKEDTDRQRQTVHGEIKCGTEEVNYKVSGFGLALYAAETWTLMQADRSKLEAF